MRRNIPVINNIRYENDRKHIYETLCRHQISVNIKAQSRLYCYYKMDRPYLRLAPFKVEIVRQNPLIVLFHDIISDEEARIIEMLAVPKGLLLNCRLCRSGYRFVDVETSVVNCRIIELMQNPEEEECEGNGERYSGSIWIRFLAALVRNAMGSSCSIPCIGISNTGG
ncbi:unnamed protein product [Onchocerca flexuosa]|uniref:Tudor domain-containing protein n=1 Tax=Onchocerca flexuosa TaxID=387005 RepID=A0A183H975_9BILA|nr:unnamed protein product [Onchocerca flexuosa]